MPTVAHLWANRLATGGPRDPDFNDLLISLFIKRGTGTGGKRGGHFPFRGVKGQECPKPHVKCSPINYLQGLFAF